MTASKLDGLTLNGLGLSLRLLARMNRKNEMILGSCWNQNFQKSIQSGNQDASSVFDSIEQNSPFSNPFAWPRIHFYLHYESSLRVYTLT